MVQLWPDFKFGTPNTPSLPFLPNDQYGFNRFFNCENSEKIKAKNSKNLLFHFRFRAASSQSRKRTRWERNFYRPAKRVPKIANSLDIKTGIGITKIEEFEEFLVGRKRKGANIFVRQNVEVKVRKVRDYEGAFGSTLWHSEDPE